MTDVDDDDLRLDLAAALAPGDVLMLLRGDGPLERATVTDVRGLDVVVAVDGAVRISTAELLTARLRDPTTAWFASFVARGGEDRPGGVRLLTLTIAQAVRIEDPRRWSERVPFSCVALLREEGAAGLVRGTVVDLGLTGTAVLVAGDAAPLDAHVGVTLEGDGRGAIAFRAQVVRRHETAGRTLLGLEVLGISAVDHARLARLLARHTDDA